MGDDRVRIGDREGEHGREDVEDVAPNRELAALLDARQERAAVGVWVLITACIALMLYAFLTFDFSVRYVAFNTNRGTPFYYRITALWGALEGSIVLWSWLLSIYALIVVVQYRRRQPELYPWVLSVMLGVLSFFLLVMTIPAPPFERLSPIPPDGRGLNPLLEDSGMITHPVALYLGFTGFTVPFAFAIAGSTRLDAVATACSPHRDLAVNPAKMLAIALAHRPHAACIVPEKREERTTEGGLDAARQRDQLAYYVDKLGAAGSVVGAKYSKDAGFIGRSAVR